MVPNILKQVQVNCPYVLLMDKYMDRFVDGGINPEIGIDAAALERFSPRDFDRAARCLADSGLTVTLHAPFADLSPGSSDPQVRQLTRKRFEQTLVLVSVFRPRTVVCHAGYDWKRYGFDPGGWLERSLGIWTWLGARLADEGAALMLENVYEHGPGEMIDLFDAIGRAGVAAGFCLDTGHQAVFSRTGLEDWLNALGHRIGQLHLHDNTGAADDHLAPGQGTIDFSLLFSRLGRLLPEPPVVTLEPHREEDLVPGLRYIERLWPW